MASHGDAAVGDRECGCHVCNSRACGYEFCFHGTAACRGGADRVDHGEAVEGHDVEDRDVVEEGRDEVVEDD